VCADLKVQLDELQALHLMHQQERPSIELIGSIEDV
jgi:hypothetical protein